MNVNKKGFTLIEIVAVIVVLGILSVFTFSFIDNAVKTYSIVNKHRILYQEASYIMERITRELRDVKNLISPASIGTTTNLLQFNKAHGTPQDTNTTIVFTRDTGTNNFFRSSGGTPILIGQNVTKFEITRANAGTCNISLSISITLTNGDQSFSLNSTVTPKNLGANLYNDRCFNGDYEDVVQ